MMLEKGGQSIWTKNVKAEGVLEEGVAYALLRAR